MAEIAVTVERISIAMEELPFRLLQTKTTRATTHIWVQHTEQRHSYEYDVGSQYAVHKACTHGTKYTNI